MQESYVHDSAALFVCPILNLYSNSDGRTFCSKHKTFFCTVFVRFTCVSQACFRASTKPLELQNGHFHKFRAIFLERCRLRNSKNCRATPDLFILQNTVFPHNPLRHPSFVTKQGNLRQFQTPCLIYSSETHSIFTPTPFKKKKKKSLLGICWSF